MNIYNAILKAAAHIESEQSDFWFGSMVIPACGTPGCAIGWIGHFLGFPSGTPIWKASEAMDLGSDRNFYDKLDQLAGDNWHESASIAAIGLRLYAEKYHSAERGAS